MISKPKPQYLIMSSFYQPKNALQKAIIDELAVLNSLITAEPLKVREFVDEVTNRCNEQFTRCKPEKINTTNWDNPTRHIDWQKESWIGSIYFRKIEGIFSLKDGSGFQSPLLDIHKGDFFTIVERSYT
jgi:hypothetical protein